MKKFGFFVLALTVCMGVVFGQDAAAPAAEAVSNKSYFMGVGIDVIWQVFGGAIVILLGIAGKKLLKLVGLKESAAADAAVDVAIQKGISFAEQWSKNKAKELKEKPSNDDKKKQAVDFAYKLLIDKGLAAKASGKLESLIESKLGEGPVAAKIRKATTAKS